MTAVLLSNPRFDNLANLSLESQQILINLLQQNTSIDICLQNCSNQGICQLNETYVCVCSEYFIGSKCQTDIRPCASYPCLNNGTCLNINETDFACECQKSFHGLRCENQDDLCRNRTCSKNGYCFVNSTRKVSQCKCSIGFSGDDCENEDNSSKQVRTIFRYISLVLVVACFLILITLIISNDVLNLLGIKDKGRVNLKPWKETSRTKDHKKAKRHRVKNKKLKI